MLSRCVQFRFIFSPLFRHSVSLSVSIEPTFGAVRILSHRSRVQKVTYLHQYTNNHRWLPHEVRQCQFSFVSKHQRNSKVLENRPVEFRFWSNMILIHENSQSAPEILSSFDIWIWISGFSLFFWRKVPPTLYTAVDSGCPSCKVSPVLHGNTNSLFLLRIPTCFDVNLST